VILSLLKFTIIQNSFFFSISNYCTDPTAGFMDDIDRNSS